MKRIINKGKIGRGIVKGNEKKVKEKEKNRRFPKPNRERKKNIQISATACPFNSLDHDAHSIKSKKHLNVQPGFLTH
jgi:hypothetical protein